MALKVWEVPTEQWIGSEWVVSKDGKVIHADGAEEGHVFGFLRCWIWVLFHPGVW